MTLTLGQPRIIVGMTGRTEDIQASDNPRDFSIDHEGVTVSVSRGGRGRPVVLCPGLFATQSALYGLLRLLRREHDVLAFDLRGHGLSSAAAQYRFADFRADLSAVMAAGQFCEQAPVLVGYSLGADLAVHYAATHPGAVAGLVLIDGANPIPEPFIPAADRPLFRAVWENSVAAEDNSADPALRVVLTAQQVLDLNLELDTFRTGSLLGSYRDITAPISMITSTSMAGAGGDERTRWRNRNWRAGIERLSRHHPDITTTWLDADHQLVFTHAPEIARLVADHLGRLPGPGH